MSRSEPQATADAPQPPTGRSDRTRRQEVRDEAAALRAESRQTRRHAAEVRGDRNAILDAVGLLVTAVLRARGLGLLAPVAARFRMFDHGSTGVEIALRLQDPSRADAARAALREHFPDPLLDVIVS